MIKWEKPILVPLRGVTSAQGLCNPGSGDVAECRSTGNSAGVKCLNNGNSADPTCDTVGNAAPIQLPEVP